MQAVTVLMTWLVLIGVGATVLAFFMDAVDGGETHGDD